MKYNFPQNFLKKWLKFRYGKLVNNGPQLLIKIRSKTLCCKYNLFPSS